MCVCVCIWALGRSCILKVCSCSIEPFLTHVRLRRITGITCPALPPHITQYRSWRRHNAMKAATKKKEMRMNGLRVRRRKKSKSIWKTLKCSQKSSTKQRREQKPRNQQGRCPNPDEAETQLQDFGAHVEVPQPPEETAKLEHRKRLRRPQFEDSQAVEEPEQGPAAFAPPMAPAVTPSVSVVLVHGELPTPTRFSKLKPNNTLQRCSQTLHSLPKTRKPWSQPKPLRLKQRRKVGKT